MINIGETMFKLNEKKYFNIHTTITLLDIPTKKEIERGLQDKVISSNEIFVFAASNYTDIKIETIFDTIIPIRNITAYLECSCILKYVSVNPSYEIDYIPKGYSAICLFEFPDGKPDMLNKLAYYGEKKDYTKHDTLILTQKAVMDKLLEEKSKTI
jgi:hypothetical protein